MGTLHPLFISHFVAMFLGLYMLISALVMIARAQYYRDLVESMPANSPGLMIGSSFTLIFGLVLVMLHNHWEWSVHVVVTIICWMILIKAILWLLFPEGMLRNVKKIYRSCAYYYFAGFIALLGIFLIVKVQSMFVGF